MQVAFFAEMADDFFIMSIPINSKERMGLWNKEQVASLEFIDSLALGPNIPFFFKATGLISDSLFRYFGRGIGIIWL